MFSTERVTPASLAGRKVTVMGLGLFDGGRGVTELLCRHGAVVTVTDRRSQEVLEKSVRALDGLPVRWVLGEHREEDFLGADLVIPSPAVRRDSPYLQLCRERGIPLETEMNLTFKLCRGRICAVTGSNGKTTTTSLVGAMARQRWPRTRIGGNLGKSLLPEVEAIQPGEWVVLELSSFQLEDLRALERRPEVSVVTNLSPNHLDRHGTYAAYLAAKREIVGPAGAPNVAVLNGEDPQARSWASCGREVVFFGRAGTVRPRARGVWLNEEAGEVVLATAANETFLFPSRDLRLVGRFNLLNAAAAAAAATAMEVAPAAIRAGVREFEAVEHRLEPVLEHRGVKYLNDSKATTPESTIAALEALGPNVVVICGGSAKGCSFDALGRVIAVRARACVLLGQTAAAIEAAIPRQARANVRRAASLEEAVAIASQLARSGDQVLLSPSCASHDMFVSFEERGRRFKDLARELARRPSS